MEDYYVKEAAENLQMHIDVDAWWEELQARQIAQKYGVNIGTPEDYGWKLRDFTLSDPSVVV